MGKGGRPRPETAPGGRFGNLFTQDLPGLEPLLAEEAEVLWRTLHWPVEPWAGPREGLTWIAGGKVLGYLPLRLSGRTVVAGRVFASRTGPAQAVEAALLDAAIRGAISKPLVQGFFGEQLGVAPETLEQLRARWPGQVRLRALMEVAWPASPASGAVPEGPGPTLEPWRVGHLVPAAGLLWRAYAGVPQFLPDPALETPAGIAFLLERITTQPVCGRFEPGASFVARAPGAGELQGFVLASRLGADRGLLTELAVDPAARRGGLGRALVIQALDALRGLGCRTIQLSASLDDPKVMALYGRLGFQEYHRFPDLRIRSQMVSAN